jgi:hypothetical protein
MTRTYSSPCTFGISCVGWICGAAGFASTVAGAATCGGRPGLHGSRLLRRRGRRGRQRLCFASARRRRSWYRHRGGTACDMRDRHRRPRWPPDGADRRRAHRPKATRQIVVEIVAHPVGRDEAHDPPGAGVDHQPPVIAATIDHGNRVDDAAPLGNSQRQEPVLAQHGVDLGRRQQGRPVARGRDIRRHRGIGALDVGDDRVWRSSAFLRRQDLRTCPGGHDNQSSGHDPPCEQLHRLFAPVTPHAQSIFRSLSRRQPHR